MITRSKSLQEAQRLMEMAENTLRGNFRVITGLLISLNFFFALFVIRRVPYTEIDWIAYMQEVGGVLKDHEYDYKFLRGDTGPLVYPAGFVYIYSLLYEITDEGSNILLAQYIFAGLHSVTLLLVILLYRRCYEERFEKRFPLVIVSFLFISRRVLSLFVLRLFNDCVQMLLLYASIFAMTANRWGIGCFLFSLSVSVKMNALLFAPGLAVLLCQARGTGGFIRLIFGVCLTTQLVLGVPFLMEAPWSYLSRAFEFTREFSYKWSVNGAVFPEPIFLDKKFALSLFIAHLTALLCFGHFRWTNQSTGGLIGLLHMQNTGFMKWITAVVSTEEARELTASHIVFVLFTSNFIGIAFARTLHYQFYVWYAHTIPFLVWGGRWPAPIKLCVILVIEFIFNVYPPHWATAAALHLAHLMVLLSLWNESSRSEERIFLRKSSKR